MFFTTSTTVIPPSFIKTGVLLVYGSSVTHTANTNTTSTHAIIYLFAFSYLTVKVTLASERKLILSYFCYNTWTAATQENREFFINISNELQIFHPGLLVTDA